MDAIKAFTANPKTQDINRWVMLGLTVLSWIFAVVSVASCTFMKIEVSASGFSGLLSNEFEGGVFSGKIGDGNCESYDDVSGSAHRSAQAFGTIASLSASACLIMYPLVILILKEKARDLVWKITKILYVVTLVCVLLTFTFLAACDEFENSLGLSDLEVTVDCKLGAAGGITVFHVLLLIAMVAAAWLIPLPDKDPVFEIPQAKTSAVAPPQTTTTKTIENLPDGAKKITEVTIDEKGKTETVTIEQTEGV